MWLRLMVMVIAGAVMMPVRAVAGDEDGKVVLGIAGLLIAAGLEEARLVAVAEGAVEADYPLSLLPSAQRVAMTMESYTLVDPRAAKEALEWARGYLPIAQKKPEHARRDASFALARRSGQEEKWDRIVGEAVADSALAEQMIPALQIEYAMRLAEQAAKEAEMEAALLDFKAELLAAGID